MDKEDLFFSGITNTNYHKIFKLFNRNNCHDRLTKTVYRPINDSRPFNLQLNPSEITKTKNVNLINNNTLRDIIIKYNNSKRKKSQETTKTHKYYYNKFKDELKNYNLALNIILKKKIDNFQKFMPEKKPIKLKKLNLKVNISRNKGNYFNKMPLKNKSSGLCTTYPNMQFSKTEPNKLRKKKGISQYSEKTSNTINFFYKKKFDTKIKLMKNVNGIKDPKIQKKYVKKSLLNLNIKKPLCFSYTNIFSKKLGKLSIFGVFEDFGEDGKNITSIIINYLIDYFQNCKEMVVCLEKNNFYSILHWSFVNAQKYLIKNAKQLGIDLSSSGCAACIILIPRCNNNIIYCANSGKCKCILYTNRGIDCMNFKSDIERKSERERIFKKIRLRKMEKLEGGLKKGLYSIDETGIYNDKNKNIKDKRNSNINISNEDKKINNESEDINEEMYIKYFSDFGITRCFGKISGLDMGLGPEPEITEYNLRTNKVKVAVLGNTKFWKYLDEKEVRFIVSKYLKNNDTIGATKELDELIKQKVGLSSKVLHESSFVVIFFDTII